jgi:phosphatidylserine/phosphatidylglycerophosphate/cardiolipin synthase-like enzyme
MYRGSGDGISVAAYTGDRAVLLAFDLAADRVEGLAGFAVACTPPDTARSANRAKDEYFLQNRLNFAKGVSAGTPFSSEQWTPSNKAPFQTFHWTHYPSTGPGKYTYTVYAVYFAKDRAPSLSPLSGPMASVEVDLRPVPPGGPGGVEIGFTRSMVSSQAYTNRYKNRGLHPEPQTMDFDTAAYRDQYSWLGAHAREAIVAFLERCRADPGTTLDVFAFDFDEPDIIRTLCAMGNRVRVFQDNSDSHCNKKSPEQDMRGSPNKKDDPTPPREPDTVRALRKDHVAVRTGHFTGLSHNKVMVRRTNGVAEAVLTGSANFTVRGLYVQANSVLVFEEPQVAALYAQAFDQAWEGAKEFKRSDIAAGWHHVEIGAGRYAFSFAPHETAFPLDRINEAIAGAKQSVLFAMMQVAGSGTAIDAVKALPDREDLYSMGIIQQKAQMKLFKPDTGVENFTVASHAYLAKDVPAPFSAEISGGFGQVIHHKLVICDFNGNDPVVFCGSSNLAKGGETSNSDNLLAIHDRDAATTYAVEAVRLYDHFRFRSLREASTAAKPLVLQPTSAWAEPYYNPGSIRYRERVALAGTAGE